MKAILPYLDHQFKVEQYTDMLRAAQRHHLLAEVAGRNTSYVRGTMSAMGRTLVRLGCQLQGWDASRVLAAAADSKSN
jgi:hypothetical protein